MSYTNYRKLAADQNAQQCQDVGFQSQTESQPYAHSLRTLLPNGNRCQICWSLDYRMYSCPDRSRAVKADMDKKLYVSSYAGSLVSTKLKLQENKKRCLKVDYHIVAVASVQEIVAV